MGMLTVSFLVVFDVAYPLMKPSKNNPVKHQGQTSKADDQMPHTQKKQTHIQKVMKYAERGGKRQARGQSHGELFFSNEMHVNWP